MSTVLVSLHRCSPVNHSPSSLVASGEVQEACSNLQGLCFRCAETLVGEEDRSIVEAESNIFLFVCGGQRQRRHRRCTSWCKRGLGCCPSRLRRAPWRLTGFLQVSPGVVRGAQPFKIFLVSSWLVRMDTPCNSYVSSVYRLRLRIPGYTYDDPISLAQLPKEADKAALGGVDRGRHGWSKGSKTEPNLLSISSLGKHKQPLT